MKLQANQLASHLKSSLAPCYLISGDEHLLVNEALDTVREAARREGFLSRDAHVATTGFDWNVLHSAGANMSLFAEKRLIELRLPTGKPGRVGSQAIADMVEQLNDELMLVVVTPKLDRSAGSSKWVKTIEKAGVNLPIWPIELRDLPGWIAQRMRATGLNPDKESVRMLAARVEGNLLAAAQEIEKLRLLVGEGDIGIADVARAVADSSRFDVFKLTDAALAGRADRAARILYGLRHEGISEVVVLWSLSRELRLLTTLAAAVERRQDLGTAMKKNGVWMKRQSLVRNCLSRHSPESLHDLMSLAADADAMAKGRMRGDPWQIAMDILFGLSYGARKAA